MLRVTTRMEQSAMSGEWLVARRVVEEEGGGLGRIGRDLKEVSSL